MDGIEFKELLKVATETLREKTIHPLLKADTIYQQDSENEGIAETDYLQLDLTEEQRNICNRLLECRDQQDIEYGTKRCHLRANTCRAAGGQSTEASKFRTIRRIEKMAVNQKAVKVLNKVFEAGFSDEKAISAMTMDDILSMQGITVADIGLINDLQKSIKANKVISFLGGGTNE